MGNQCDVCLWNKELLSFFSDRAHRLEKNRNEYKSESNIEGSIDLFAFVEE